MGELMARAGRTADQPKMVALVSASSSLAMGLLSLPAGGLGDIFDRRRLLAAAQTWLALCAGALGALTILGWTTPEVLLGVTFAMGLGNAISMPAWSAIIPEIAPGQELPPAIALNAVNFNISRAVGPALGGLVFARWGAGHAFLLNAVSFVGVIGVLAAWRRARRESVLPAERLGPAMRAGMRFVRHDPGVRAVLLRSGAIMVCGSAFWALLPSFAQVTLELGPTGYGALLAAFGSGAIAGASAMPRLRAMYSADAVVGGATLLFAASIAALSLLHSPVLVAGALFVAGAQWLAIFSTLSVSLQILSPDWVRARAIAVYGLVFFGAQAAGATLWGELASREGVRLALGAAGAGLAASLVGHLFFRLPEGTPDLAPAGDWPAPPPLPASEHDRGPVLVTVEYRIDVARAAEFEAAVRALEKQRRRDGAFFWALFRDTADGARYVEEFLCESWIEHLRQHERVTIADRAAAERVKAFLTAPAVVGHLLACDERRGNGG
jgi:predicted MFS family arabinose efflux permease